MVSIWRRYRSSRSINWQGSKDKNEHNYHLLSDCSYSTWFNFFDPQNNRMRCRCYHFLHFMVKGESTICPWSHSKQVKWQNEDLNPGCSTPQFPKWQLLVCTSAKFCNLFSQSFLHSFFAIQGRSPSHKSVSLFTVFQLFCPVTFA